MKSVWSGLLVAFSMYSAVPVPQVRWEKRTMRWALAFLPLVGALAGALERLWFAFCARRGAEPLFYAAGAALLPLAVSGGVHLDGLCDTCDALCSFGSRDKRLAILKDPHVGAFGPLWLCAFLLAEAGCFAQLYRTPALLPLACAGFALARALGGAKVVLSPCAKDSGLARLFAENSDRRAVFAALAAEFAAITVWLVRQTGAAPALGAAAALLLWYALHEKIARGAFGGITGDLAGFCISIGELLALFCAAAGGLLL